MKTKPVLTLYKKEIMDLLRDKKTIIVMILIPIFLYPTMLVISLFVLQGVQRETQSREYKIAMLQSPVSDSVFDILADEEDDFDYNFKKIDYTSLEQAKQDLIDKKVHLVVVSTPLQKDEETQEYFGDAFMFNVEIFDLNADSKSLGACQNVESVLSGYSKKLRSIALENAFDNAEIILNPIGKTVESISTNEEDAGSVIGLVLPFILVTSILTGAIYPAIDATAGERERGTLETIMTLPVRKSDVMISKFLSVSTIAVFSAVLNLVSMFFVLFYMMQSINASSLGLSEFRFHQFIPAIISLAVCLPVFSMFTSALSLCICIFARSFKEANNITSPLLIVFMFATMASAIPSVELTEYTALIPVTNIALLIKSVFSLDYDWKLVAIVLFSNLAYCVVMVMLMSTLFSSENILFGEGSGGIHLFENRKNLSSGQIPSYADLLFLFAFMMLIMIYSSSFLVLKGGLWGSAVVQLLIFAFPVLYSLYIRCDMKELYSLHAPKVREMIGAAVMWAGLFLLNQTIVTIIAQFIPTMSDTSDMITETVMNAGFPLALFVVGICPAIAEEAAFRGFLFGTLKARTKLWIAIVVSAACFGLYHMNLLQFFTGLFMGIFMAYMVYKSRSIFTSALFHMLNNSLSVVFMFYPELVSRIPVLGLENPGIGGYVIMVVLGLILAGAGLLLFNPRKKPESKINAN